MGQIEGCIMQKKLCIVPQRSNILRELTRGIILTEEEQELFYAAVVKHVEISLKGNRWEILLQTQEVIGTALLNRVGAYIKSREHIDNLIFYQDILNIETSINRVWKTLSAVTANGNPSVHHLLKNAKRIFDGSHLLLEVPGELAGEILQAHDVLRVLQKAIEKMLSIRCLVSYKAVDEEYAIPEEERELVQDREYQNRMTQRVKAVADVTEPSPKTFAQTEEESLSKVTKDPGGRSGLLLGKNFTGTAISLDQTEGEMKNVILMGTIARVSSREFKTNTKLLLFDLADSTNGISCKKFFKEKEKEAYERAVASVRDGMLVRVKGSIRFDTFQNDFMLFVDSMQKVEKEVREDKAPVKRIELHAHTRMSSMDAVVSPETLIKTAANWGWPAIAITDHGVVQAFPDAAKAANKLDIKIIYGMEGYLVQEDFEQKHANHIIFLAKNSNGLRNLYQMVSLSHLKYLHRQPRLPKRIIEEYREDIIVGSACEAGELIRAIVAQKTDEELLEIASFYDYLEIQPIGNNEFLVRSDKFPHIKNDDDLRRINIKVAELAKKLGKMLIATCDVHFLNPEDSIYRAILMKGKGFEDAELQPPLFLRTTEEMLAEFDYLGEEAAYEAVVTNPRKINEMIEKFKPIPDDLYSPMIRGADEEIREMSYHKARALYGENLPEIVEARLKQELTPIIGHGFSVLYLIAQRLVKKSNDDGYLVGSRGSVGSSFVATMTDITEVNPLPPHWRCPYCQFSEFVTDGSVGCGYDLPSRKCPVCGTNLLKDGHDIPFAVFLGFDGDKVPDIDLNFSGEYQPIAHKYTEELFGKDNVYRAGTIATVADKTAFGYVKKFFEEKGVKKHNAYIANLAAGCMGVKRTTGQHPAGIMVVPRNMDVHFFTPIQRPADDKNTTTITTHFDYHSISSRLVKLDILGHDDPTVIKMLEDLTHRDPKTIPFDDPATLSIFSSTKALGLDPKELGATSGTFGIPEFRTGFTRQMIDDTHPSCFSDLVRISGFSHGTDVWLGNAQDLIRSGQCTLRDAISARDDIMMYLIHKGIDPLLSFQTMESVRKGKGIKPEIVEVLRKGGIPEWYIGACQKIKYMFPRAHATAYVMMAWRIAYCKVHYPLAFYAAYFSIRAAEFDADVVARGKDYVKRQLDDFEARDSQDIKDKATIIVLQLAWEMYLRGFTMERVDIYRSNAEKFILHEKSLLPPLASLGGVGASAARSIVEARKDGVFTSIEDIKKRTGISKTCIDALQAHGCLSGFDESDQMELFM